MGAVSFLAVAMAAVLALVVYLRHERLGAAGVGLAALRTTGMAALIVLLWDPVRAVRVQRESPTVLLDASLSMGGAGGRWAEALDTAAALAGRGGTVLRFGRGVVPSDTTPPLDGATHLSEALAVAHGRGGPVVIITDGEVEDRSAVDRSLMERVRVVVLPRVSVPNASLVEANLPDRATAQDTVSVAVGAEFTHDVRPDSARVEVWEGARRLAQRTLPVSPGGLVRRIIVLPPGLLAAGEHVLRVRLTLAGDAEPRDNERTRLIMVAAEPAITVIAVPGDWEARFLTATLGEIVRVPIQAYALVRPGHWLNLRTLLPAPEADVVRRSQAANLVVTLGSTGMADGHPVVWRWRGADSAASVLTGDWYLVRDPPSSPLAGRLSGVAWDSLPPLTGIVPTVPAVGEWTGLAARLGRRGADRPVLVGRDSAGTRHLTVTGDGLWRWALRGGAPREAYRAVVAAGTDWLLGADVAGPGGPLAVVSEVPRGVPAVFRWRAGEPPDSVVVRFTGAASRTAALRFDGEGRAPVLLEPGVYQWALADPRAGVRTAGGTLVVEEYSDEFRSRAASLAPAPGSGGFMNTFQRARHRWWLFGLVLVALVAEWTWRLRRGLP